MHSSKISIRTSVLAQMSAHLCAGIAVQALACTGTGESSVVAVNETVREVAVAVAQAVSQAQVACSSSGGAGTLACGFSSASVDAVAKATVRRPMFFSQTTVSTTTHKRLAAAHIRKPDLSE